MASDIRNYAAVTAAYWGFTLTDGALRMLVLLHFHILGYSPFQLALLFLLYELMGVVTNLLGGWIAARFGLKLTLYCGLAIQIAALTALSALNPDWPKIVSVVYVLIAQGLSGIAKDLTKMSSKSAIKLLVSPDQPSLLFRWVALLTGSKNALKGVGFFLGGLLLATLGFAGALWLMAGCLAIILVAVLIALPADMGIAKTKTKFTRLLSKSRAVNMLSAARVFLFAARDVWFVVGLPVFLYDVLNWSFTEVGGFLALWIIGYGAVQGLAPTLIARSQDGRTSEIRAARLWVFALAAIPLAIAIALQAGLDPTITLILGLGIFGFIFAVNSALHSYLILALTNKDQVALNVGFYYMANAAGRLAGTLLSGIAYQLGGLTACLLTAAGLLVLSGLFAAILMRAAQLDAEAGAFDDGPDGTAFQKG